MSLKPDITFASRDRFELTLSYLSCHTGKHTTQYHDLFAFHAGKIVGYAAEVFIILQCLGTGVAQVVACAADWYAIDQSYSKRQLQVFWGAILQLFILFPTFRHFRVLNVLALVGTTYTAIWLLYEANYKGYNYPSSVYRLWPIANAAGTITGTISSTTFEIANLMLKKNV